MEHYQNKQVVLEKWDFHNNYYYSHNHPFFYNILRNNKKYDKAIWYNLLGDKMNVKICDKCRGTKIETLVPKLKKITSIKKIEIGCRNFCGIGFLKPVALVDNMPVITEDEDSLIEEIIRIKNKSQ